MANNDINFNFKAQGADESVSDINKMGDALEGLSSASGGGDKISGILGKIQKVSESLKSTGVSGFREMTAIFREFSDGIASGSLSVMDMGRAFTALRAVLAGPLGWILGIVGAIGAAIKMWAENTARVNLQKMQINLDNMKSTMATIKEDTDRYVHLLELAADKRRSEKQLMDEQLEAQSQINDLIREREKLRSGNAGMSEEQRFELDATAKARKNRLDTEKDRQMLSSDREQNEADINDIDAKIKRLEEDAKEYQRISRKEGREAVALSRKYNGFWESRLIASLFNDSNETAQMALDKIRLSEEAGQSFIDTMQEIEKLKNQRKALVGKRATFPTRERGINERESLNAETLKREREEEDLRRSFARREREREIAIRERDESLREDEYVRGRDEWKKSLDEKLDETSKRIEKFSKQADAATKEMRRLEEANKDNADWNERDRRRYDELKEDRSHAMSQMYSAQQEQDALSRSEQETAWADEDRLRQQKREDEDFERQKRLDFASWEGKVASEEKRLEEARAMREEAENALKRRATLSARDIALLEEQRDVGRSREVEARGNLYGLMREGDRETAAFEAKMRGQGGNRLTAMGLGGDVSDYSRQTARNTARLVEINKEMLTKFAGGPHTGIAGRLGEVSWTMR